MSDSLKYAVLPKKVEPQPTPGVDSLPLEKWEKEKIKGIGPLAVVIIAALLSLPIIFLLTDGLRRNAPESGVVVGGFGALAVAFLVDYAVRSRLISQKEREKARRAKQSVESSNKTAVSQAEAEARNLTSELTRTYESRRSPLRIFRSTCLKRGTGFERPTASSKTMLSGPSGTRSKTLRSRCQPSTPKQISYPAQQASIMAVSTAGRTRSPLFRRPPAIFPIPLPF